MEITRRKRERQWEKGFHTIDDGTVKALTDMDDFHLRRTINAFKSYSTRPLQQEINRRSFVVVLAFLKAAQKAPAVRKAHIEQKEQARKARRALNKYLKLLA